MIETIRAPQRNLIGARLYKEILAAKESKRRVRRFLLDTNVAIDIENFYYGRMRNGELREALRRQLLRMAGDGLTDQGTPDIHYGWAIMEASWRRGIGMDPIRERRMRRALQVVVSWNERKIEANFKNRHPPCNRDNDRRGGPAALAETDEAHPGAALAGRYCCLLYLRKLDRERSRWRHKGPNWAFERFAEWMNLELRLVGPYELQIAMDLLVGDDERMNGARRLLKISGDERPDVLADRCWNAAWDMFFLYSTEAMTHGLMGPQAGRAEPTALVTRNLDPEFVRMLAESKMIRPLGDLEVSAVEIDWSRHPRADHDRVLAAVEPLVSGDGRRRIRSSVDLAQRSSHVVDVVRSLEAELQIERSALAGLEL